MTNLVIIEQLKAMWKHANAQMMVAEPSDHEYWNGKTVAYVDALSILLNMDWITVDVRLRNNKI